jgi:hypothetical protein
MDREATGRFRSQSDSNNFNQELELAVKSAVGSTDSYTGTAFPVFPNGDYQVGVYVADRLQSLGDQIVEPILTYATRRKCKKILPGSN